jgi:hypothetical protein
MKIIPVHPKVSAAGLAGLVGTVVAWALAASGYDIPAEVQVAITSLVMVLIGWLVPGSAVDTRLVGDPDKPAA